MANEEVSAEDRRKQKIHIRMSKPERELLEKLLEGKKYYLEFGCGGSTELALEMGCRKVVSVESSAEWIAQLSEKPRIREALDVKRLIFERADLGPVSDWGFPAGPSRIKNWPDYYLAPFIKHQIAYQFILIDGRFRKACAYASWAFMDDDAVVAVHDYVHRDGFSEIEKFFNVEGVAGSLVVLSKKTKVLPRTFYSAALKTMLDPS